MLSATRKLARAWLPARCRTNSERIRTLSDYHRCSSCGSSWLMSSGRPPDAGTTLPLSPRRWRTPPISSPPNPSRWFSSVIQRSIPRMAHVEILSLGMENVVGGDDENIDTKGILTHVVPVDSRVRVGDVVAKVALPLPKQDNDDNPPREDEQQREALVYAPQTGRVAQVFHQIRDPVKVGDILMHIDDQIYQADAKSLEKVLQNLAANPRQQKQETPKLPQGYVKTLLEIEDAFRLQTIVQQIPLPLQSQCLPLYERLMELQKDDPIELANTHTQIGVVLYNLGDLELTLQHLHQALDLRQEALGSDHPQVAATYIHLGALYRNAKDLERSLECMLRAVDVQKQSLGEEHPMVASTYNNIGALHHQSNDFARAIREYEKALRIHLQRSGGDRHPDTAGTYHNLGVAWKHLGDLKTSQEYLQKALHLRKHHYEQQESVGNNTDGDKRTIGGASTNVGRSSSLAGSNVAASHTSLGQLYAEMANYEAAMEQYDAALGLHERMFGPDSPQAASVHNHVGAVHYEMGSNADAMKAYQKALSILSGKEPHTSDAAASWNNVGLTHLKMSDPKKALEHHREALRILTGIYGPNHPNLATTIGSIGNAYKAQEQWEMALAEYTVAHELLESALGTREHPDVASSYNNMGLVLSHLPGREAEALEKYRAALESFEASLGSEHPHCGSCRYNTALVLQSQGQKEEARAEFEAARDIWATHFGPGHVHTENAQKGVEECT